MTACFGAVFFNRSFRQINQATIATIAAAAIHQSQSHVLGISTGPLSGRMSSELVPLACDGSTRALFELAMAQTFFARLEKASERSRIRFPGPELNGIDARGSEQLLQLALRAVLTFRERFPFAHVSRVYFHHFARFCIAQQEITERRQIQFEFVDNLNRNDVVLTVGLLQCSGGGLPKRLRQDDIPA